MSSHGDTDEAPTRSWADLPYEILSEISKYLGVIELLSFRCSCKSFLSASSTATAFIQSLLFPWLLFIRDGSQECRLYDPRGEKGYALNLPELEGTRCLASKDGWLLLLKETSVFFYCPISQAKVPLPSSWHLFGFAEDIVASFSSHPTECDCVVTVISRPKPPDGIFGLIRRGDTKWTSFSCGGILENVGAIKWTLPVSVDFFYFDSSGSGVRYNVDTSVRSLLPVFPCKIQIIGKEEDPTQHSRAKVPNVPNAVGDSEVIKAWLNLQEDESLTTRGTVMPWGSFMLPIYDENILARSGSPNGPRSKGIWIQPRYFEVPANHSW